MAIADFPKYAQPKYHPKSGLESIDLAAWLGLARAPGSASMFRNDMLNDSCDIIDDRRVITISD